jgi:hypothetical protein
MKGCSLIQPGFKKQFATVFFNDNIMSQAEALPGPFADWFGRKKQVKNFFLNVYRNADAVIGNANFHLIAI